MTDPSKNRQRGKATERAIAKRLGGIRRGILGGHDIDCGAWAVEVKDRVNFVGNTFMQQAERNCPPGKTPLVVVHQTGRRHADDLVMLRLSDWLDLHGPLVRGSE